MPHTKQKQLWFNALWRIGPNKSLHYAERRTIDCFGKKENLIDHNHVQQCKSMIKTHIFVVKVKIQNKIMYNKT